MGRGLQKVVYNHWTGLVDWTGGLPIKSIFMASSKTHWPVRLYDASCSVADLEFWRVGFQYVIKARVAHLFGGLGACPQQGKFWISDLLRLYSWGKIQLLNLVVVLKPAALKPAWLRFEPQSGCKAAGYPRKAQENKHSHTDSILASL